jgi:RHS repeat-associated protein
MNARRTSRPARPRIGIALGVSLVLLAAGLPFLTSAPAVAAGTTPLTSLTSPPGPPPGPISLADRTPVRSVPDENGVRNPRQAPVPVPRWVRPDQPPPGAKLLPSQGGSDFNVYGVGPDHTAHVAQLFPGQVNERQSNGDWTDVRSDLQPEPGSGWQTTVDGVTVHFPATLSAGTPVRVDLPGGGTLSLVPEGVAGSISGVAAQGAVTYSNALPQTDLVYRAALGGYEEDVVLKTPQASGTLSYLVEAAGVSLRTTPTGDVEVVSAGTAVGRIQRPVVFDSSPNPASTLGSLSLHDLGAGSYRLGVAVDGTFLAKATYPVSIDPGYQQISVDTADTYVDSANPNLDNSSWNALFAKGGTPTYRAFVRFNTTGLSRPGRLVYDASLFMYVTSGPGNGPVIDASRVTSAWPTPLTWNTQPSVGVVIDSKNCGPSCSGWMIWQMKSMYQHILDPANPDPWSDYGARMSTTSTTYYGFYSGNGLAPPVLQVTYNDLPDAPNASFPRDGYVSEDDSPTLKISSIPSDPNGDEVLVQYQVSDDPNNFTGSHLIWQSSWTDEHSYVVPTGILVDGQTYYWRAQSWDICTQPDTFCSLTDGQGVTRQQNASPSRAVTIVLKHFGDDSRWAMWSHDLGNGMTAKVNEANGNLFLDLPLDTLSTAVGDLSAGLSYNSQQNADLGVTPGWDLSIGPKSSARDLPKELVKLGDPSDFPDAGVKIKLGGGRTIYFPHRERRVFASAGSGAGVVKQNTDGTFLYTAADGSTYTFTATGKLIKANPASSQLSSGSNALTYTFNPSEQLTQVSDPKGRNITVTWSGGHPSAITTWAGQTWNLSYSGGHLSSVSISVTNPSTLPSPTTVTETEGFSYNGNGLLSEIDNGVTSAGNRTGWVISYLLDPKGNYRVSTITAPGAGASSTPTPWTFQYAAPYYGSTASTTCVTDPLVTPAAQFCTGAHQTKVDFNTAGFPIRIAGPADQTGYWPVTTTIFDSNNNMVCKRTPAANAVSEITGSTQCQNDPLSTKWTYNNDAPYQMLSEKHPAPNADGTGARVLDTYQYDADTNGGNFNGLWVEKYGNQNLAGVPADEGVWYGFDQTWGAGAPPGVPGGGDNWSLRWSGYLNLTSWSAAKRAAFRVTTYDEGVTLILGNTALLDCVGTTQPQGTYNCGTNQDKSKKLWPGLVPITIEYADLSGNASFKFEWDQGSGNWQTIPDFQFQSNLGLLVFETTNDGTQDVVQTHYVLDTDDAKARRLPSRVSVKDFGTAEVRKTDYTYNQYGQVTTITAAAETSLAATTTNTYTNDATTSCLTKVVDPTGAEADYTCSAAGDVTSATQVVRAVASQGAQSRVTTTEYDSLGRVTKVSRPSGGYTITTYDRAGRAVNLDTYLGSGAGHDAHAYTDYVYDDAGHLTDETLPAVPDPAHPGQTIRPTVHHVYDWLDDETSRTDVRGKIWQTAYDSFRRTIQTTSPTGLVASTEYRLSNAGAYQNRVTTWTPPGNPSGVATVTDLNVLGWKTSEHVGSLAATTYAYDARGNVTQVTDPAGTKAQYAYNGYSQITSSIDFYQSAQAATTTSSYDAAGRLRTVNGPRTDVDDSITYDYDLAGRLTTATQNGLILPGTPSTPVATSYVWDDAGERVRVTQPMSSTQNLVRDWTYDTSGRLASYADAKGTTTYSYGAGDFLESVADPRSLTLKFEYDNLGRRSRRYALSGANTVDDQTFTYDLAGNMLSAKVVASGTTITMDYDNDGRLSHVYQASYPTPTTTFGYNATTGRLASIVDPAGTTSYTYTANGQLYQLTEPFSTTKVTYTYDTAGRITKRTDGGGLCWTQTYESGTGRADVRTIRVNGSNCNSTILGTFDLGYDLSSNVTSRAETVVTETGANNPDSGTWTYAYDPANRMSSSTAPSSTVTTYGYDGAGNRTSVKVGAGSPVTTAYDGAGLPISSSDGTTYTHDGIGELTKIDKTGGTTNDWNMVYDAWGNTKSAAHDPNGTPDVTYTLDALDRMLSRTAGGTSTSYTYRGTGEDAAKIQVGASTPVYYDFTASGPLAQRTGTDSTTLRYYLRDLHGDVIAAAATSGTNRVKGSILYSPWGQPGARTGEMSTSPTQGYLGFQADLTDSSTGQVDMLTRSYEPTLGRFIKRDVLFGDPANPVSLNQFSYAQDAPVTYADPTGMHVAMSAGGGGPCDRACQADAAEKAAQVAAFNEATSLPITTYTKIIFNDDLPLQERIAAARILYAGYGKAGRQIAIPWMQSQQDALQSSTWSQITEHFWSSWLEGPAAPKWIGAGVGGGALLCIVLSGACAAAVGWEVTEAPTAERLIEEGSNGAPAAAEAQAAASSASSVQNALSALDAGRSTGVRVVQSAEDLGNLFDELSEGGTPVESSGYPGKLVQPADGTTVGLRAESASGGPAIDIKLPTGELLKVHVPG